MNVRPSTLAIVKYLHHNLLTSHIVFLNFSYSYHNDFSCTTLLILSGFYLLIWFLLFFLMHVNSFLSHKTFEILVLVFWLFPFLNYIYIIILPLLFLFHKLFLVKIYLIIIINLESPLISSIKFHFYHLKIEFLLQNFLFKIYTTYIILKV